MILEDGSEIEIGTHWEINELCIINIEQSDQNFNRWNNPKFIGINLTREQSIEVCRQILNAINDYDKLEKSLEESHAKPNTDE